MTRGRAPRKAPPRFLFALCLLLGSIIAAQELDLEAAGALCAGGSLVEIILSDGGIERARESVSWPGTTCDSDNYYSGAVKDSYTDGYCGAVYYLEVFQYYALQGQSCTTGEWALYSYQDVNGDSSVFVQLCASACTSWTTSYGY